MAGRCSQRACLHSICMTSVVYTQGKWFTLYNEACSWQALKFRSSSITSSRWRQQTTLIRALYPDRRTKELSRTTLPTGLHSAPPRSATYPHIPTASTLSFHPNEMILGIGTPDGTIRLLGCKFMDRPEMHQLRNDTPTVLSNGTRSRQLISP